jgi:hypothetical protein
MPRGPKGEKRPAAKTARGVFCFPQSQRTGPSMARHVQADSYRGIALSGLMPTPPSIIRLGGVVRLGCSSGGTLRGLVPRS